MGIFDEIIKVISPNTTDVDDIEALNGLTISSSKVVAHDTASTSFTITRESDSGTLDYTYDVYGTGVEDEDYVALTGTGSFSDGSLTSSIDITLIPESLNVRPRSITIEFVSIV